MGGDLESLESKALLSGVSANLIAPPTVEQLRFGDTLDEAFVTSMYQHMLSRAPDSGGHDGWVKMISDTGNRQPAAEGMVTSSEYRGNLVDSYYATLLGRPADAAGRANWTNALASQSEEQVIRGFLASSEYQAAYPSNASYVAGLYENLLSREGAASEIDGWTSVIDGGASRDTVAQGFLRSQEYLGLQVDSIYTQMLGNVASAEDKASQIGRLLNGEATPGSMTVDLCMSDDFANASRALFDINAGAYVTGLYQHLLTRSPDLAGHDGWVQTIAETSGHQFAAEGIVASQEFRGNLVDSYYATLLGRPADAAGRTNWTDALASQSEEQVIRGFLASSEYQAAYPSNASYVTSLYQNLLGRAGAASEIDGWTSVIDGGASRDTVAQGFLRSQEYLGLQVDGVYTQMLAHLANPADRQSQINRLATAEATPRSLRVDLALGDEFFNNTLEDYLAANYPV